MRKILACLTSALLLGATLATSYAATVEKPEAVDGSQYSIIIGANDGIPSGTGYTDSHIRFFNGGLAAATFNLLFVDPTTGLTVGTTNVSVPAHATSQITTHQLLGSGYANANLTSGKAYTIYLKSSEPLAGYQHILFNSATQLFENLSSCTNLLNTTTLASSNTLTLMSLSTSNLASGTYNYPTSFAIHNYSTASATYVIAVYNAATGISVGSTSVTVAANHSYVAPFFSAGNLAGSLQNVVGWQPLSSELWANVLITDKSGAVPQASLNEAISNVSLGGSFGMTNACAVNAPVSAALTSTTSFDGAIAGAAGQSGTFTIVVQAGSSTSVLETTHAVASTVEKPQATSQASGTLHLTTGTTVTLSGTYDTSTRALNVTGSGYTFTGGITSGSTYAGTYTTPTGATGGFAGNKASATVSSKGYCGTFSGHDSDGPVTGTFNFVATGSGTVSGSISQSDGTAARLTGTTSGTSVTGYVTGPDTNASFSGTLSATSGSGTYASADSDGTGTWTGTSCGSF